MVEVIALDGPTGSGKTTVARGLATALGCECLETGGLYRAVTLAVLWSGLDPAVEPAVQELLDRLELSSMDGMILLGGQDVAQLLRGSDVTEAVSIVAQHPSVRQFVNSFIREWVHRHGPRCVVEGRDIGSAVFPDAILKVYLHADPGVRADRELGTTALDRAERVDRIRLRDERDQSRAHGPMVMTSHMLVIDTSDTAPAEVLDLVLDELQRLKGG